MNLNVTCENPECGEENAFFNGECYECPDCNYEWGEFEMDKDEDDED
jgi:uncharacterized Zn ribbon protein